MRGSTASQRPNALDCQRLRDLLTRFNEAWKRTKGSSANVDLALYLPPPTDALRQPALHLLIEADLKFRWERGQRILLEVYCERFPELGGPEALPPELIFSEYLIGSQHGAPPPLPLYQARFSGQYDQLLHLIQDRPTSTLTDLPLCMDLVSVERTPRSLDHTSAPFAAPQPNVTAPTNDQVIRFPDNVYTLGKRLGKGTYGEVWKATAASGIEMALKIISFSVDRRETQQELSALEQVKRLKHPYLVQTLNYWILGDRLCIAMELADHSLDDRVKECGEAGLPRAELLGYLKEAAEALDFLHSKGIQHRDVKPANLLLLQGHVKVADFGLAKFLANQSMMVEATGVGTPLYMAPEIWSNQISKHSDQWSLAVIYAELRLKRVLFQSAHQGLIGLMREITSGPPDLSDLEDKERQVVLKALHQDPAQRYGSCKAFADALEAAIRPPEPTPSTASVHGPGRLLLGVVSLGVVAVCLLLCLLLLKHGERGKVIVHEKSVVVERTLPPPPKPRITLRIVPPLLVLGTGKQTSFTVQVERELFQGAVQVAASGPKGVTVAQKEIPEEEKETRLEVNVAQNGAFGDQLVIHATGRGVEQNASVPLTIVRLPPGCEKEGDAIERDADENAYYTRITRAAEDGRRVRFLLIPRQDSTVYRDGRTDPLPTFYIMQDKVSLALFRPFAEAYGRPVAKWKKNPRVGQKGRQTAKEVAARLAEWIRKPRFDQKKDDDRHPVLGLEVDEAHDFAQLWLHGRLPSVEQWKKAAGLYLKTRPGGGPYREIWQNPADMAHDLVVSAAAPSRPAALLGSLAKACAVPDVAINRTAPEPVGQSLNDVSPFGCRDMAGNGYEWTRTLRTGGEVPLENPSDPYRPYLVGRPYKNWERPLQYSDLEGEDGFRLPTGPYLKPDEEGLEVGFRVVIEP